MTQIAQTVIRVRVCNNGGVLNARRLDAGSWLAWYFVIVWGSGYLATKIGLQYAPPFTFLSLRFAFGLLLVVPIARIVRAAWPRTRTEWAHVAIAGLLMHAINLGGSHYAQYLGMSAGITALVLALQPLLTAVVAAPLMHERLRVRQWVGVVLGLAGVGLVVWHKVDLDALSITSLAAAGISLAAITTGTLYQRLNCPIVDLRAASVIQFAASLVVLVPLAIEFEGFRIQASWALFGAIAFLVIFASILAVNALHTLMRRGEATRVTSLLYMTPIIAVALEWMLFGVEPGIVSAIGIAVTCTGVAMVALQSRPRESEA